jgi:hypothetical protein
MKKTLAVFILSIINFYLFADVTFTAQAITPTAQPTAEEVQPLAQNNSVSSVNATKVIYDIKGAFQEDGAGNIYTSEFGLKAKQTLFNNFTAEGYIRFVKPFSNSNTPVDVNLMTAKLSYVGQWFTITAGREDLTKTISTLNYFGPYATAGQRYLDLIGITIPFYLKAGIPEVSELDLPIIALSFYYFPTMFDYENTTYNGYQEYYLWQLRFNATLFDSPAQIIANVGTGTTEYFDYSILSGNPCVDVSASIDIFKHVKINAAFGILNTDMTAQTSVMAAGLELHSFQKWMFIVDTAIFEMQFPLASAVSQNFNPEAAPWFFVIKNTIDRFRYGIAASNANNDFTFHNIIVNGTPTAYGSGNVYSPESLQFNGANGGGGPSWYGYIGIEY